MNGTQNRRSKLFPGKTLTWLLLMLVLAEWPAASQKLKGKIVDRAGEAVAYATVYIDELKLGTTSNARGYYELRMPPGTYNVLYQII